MSTQFPWTLSRGTVYSRERVYVLAYSKREPGTRVFRWTGEWNNYYIPFVTGGICSIHAPSPEILTMGLDGTIHSAGPDGFSTEHVDTSKEGPIHRGILRTIRKIDNHVYVAGLGRQVYYRQKIGVWARCDSGALDPLGSDNLVGFHSIDGFSEKEIYGVGLGGEIWLYNGELWHQLESPTNMILENVLCAPDGSVYITGQLGILIRGRKNNWEVMEQDLTDDNFWDMTWFNGGIWLSTIKSLYAIRNSTLSEVDLGLEIKPSFRYLDAKDGVLWSFGSNSLIYFDGDSWTEVQVP